MHPLYFLHPQSAAPQNKQLSLGVGVEANMNAVYNIAAAAWFSAALDLDQFFSVGIKAGYSYNVSGIRTLEMAALNRWYFIPPEKSWFFVQAEMGADLIFYDGKILPLPLLLGGLALGWRISFRYGYLEPVLRVGFPYSGARVLVLAGGYKYEAWGKPGLSGIADSVSVVLCQSFFCNPGDQKKTTLNPLIPISLPSK
jgi:hypothetical protein